MNDIKQQAPYCTLLPPGGAVSDCGSSGGGTMFFVSFVILNSYLLSNLFVAAIMEYVVSGLLRQGAVITNHDLETFQVRPRPERTEIDLPLKRVAVNAKIVVISDLQNTKYLVSRLNIIDSTLDALPALEPPL